MRVLVTGATGFVGRHLCAMLAERGDGVVPTGRRPLPPASVVTLDVLDAGATSTTVRRERPDAVIHLAGVPAAAGSWDRVDETIRVNVVGAAHVLRATADHAPDARVLLVGSGHQYGPSEDGRPLRETDPQRPASPYGVSKAAQEMLGLAWAKRGLQVLLARSFNHVGPGVSRATAPGSFCEQVAAIERGAERQMVVGDLEAERDFLDVRDVAAAYLALIDRGEPGEVYNVASGTPRKVGDLLDIVLSIAALDDVEVRSTGLRPGEPASISGDPSKLRALGWNPRVPLEGSLAETLDSFRR